MPVVIKIMWDHRSLTFDESLPSIKDAFLQAKWEMHGLKMKLPP